MLKNIKATFYFVQPINIVFENKCTYKIQKITVGKKILTFTFYRSKKNMVNITGIPCWSYIRLLKRKLVEMFNVSAISHRVDSLFYLIKYAKVCNLNRMVEWLIPVFFTQYRIHYHPELFSGLQMIPRKKSFPTILIFSSLSIIVMSGRNLGNIIPVRKKLDQIVKEKIL